MLFANYADEWEVEDLYDRDEAFVSELATAYPGYEYPDISWMSIKQLRAHILRANMRTLKQHADRFMATDKADDIQLAGILTDLEQSLVRLNTLVKGEAAQ